MNARELAPAAAPAHAVTVYAGRRDWWHVPTSPLRHTGPARVALGIDAADVTGIGVWAMPDLTDLPPRAQLEALDALGGSALLCALKVDTSIRGWREHHAIELLDELLGDALWVAAVERPFGTKTRWVDGRRMRALLAAAPDLLAAIERLLDEESPFITDIDSCECGTAENGSVCAHMQAARAIAKAKGEQAK